jgi:hypothetical protein
MAGACVDEWMVRNFPAWKTVEAGENFQFTLPEAGQRSLAVEISMDLVFCNIEESRFVSQGATEPL